MKKSGDRIPDEVLEKGNLSEKAEEVLSFGRGIFPTETIDPFWKIEESAKVIL